MIFLDANVYLRHLVKPTDQATTEMQSVSNALFEEVAAGLVEATTSEVVIHQVCYILKSTRLYGLATEQIIEYITHLLSLSGMRFLSGERRIYSRAFELWRQRPSLGFADSVIIARCEASTWELATFDDQLGSHPNVVRWQRTVSS